jgi:hypothetical protein
VAVDMAMTVVPDMDVDLGLAVAVVPVNHFPIGNTVPLAAGTSCYNIQHKLLPKGALFFHLCIYGRIGYYLCLLQRTCLLLRRYECSYYLH